MPASIEEHAPDWLIDLHAGRGAAPQPAVGSNLRGLLVGWRDWAAGMDFLDPASPNFAWKRLMTRMYTARATELLGELPGDGARVLDLACGGGRFTVPLARAGAGVDAVDACRPALEATARHLGDDDARLLWGDVQDLAGLPLAGPYDAAFAIELLCYLPNPAGVLSALRGLMKPGAPLVLSVEAWPGALVADPETAAITGPDALMGRTLHEPGTRWVRLYDRDELRRLLERSGWEVVGVEGTHYLLDGPLSALADPSRLDGGAYDEGLLDLESSLRADPAIGGLARAWVAVARAPA